MFEKGYKTCNGTRFHNTALKRIIQNPKYKGYYRTNTVKTLDYKTKKQILMPKEEWVVFECNDKVPPIVSEEIWEKANAILDKRSKSIMDRRENKDVYKHRYAYSGLLYCKEHGTTFHRSAGTKRKNRPVWACCKYLQQGLKGCASPVIAEKELDIVFKHILEKVIDEKEMIINGLLEIYKSIHEQHDYKTEIANTKQKQERIRQKKDKLLELSIDGLITKQEFQTRNEELNTQMGILDNELSIIDEEINKAKHIKNDIDNIRQEISKETTFDSDIKDFVNLLVDKVYVSKIDNDRDRIRLDIILKFGQPLEINVNKGVNGGFEFFVNDNECLLSDVNGYYQFEYPNLISLYIFMDLKFLPFLQIVS